MKLKSCTACSFHKEFKGSHICSQVQPPAVIVNLHDAVLCIYYTPEAAVTGPLTQDERKAGISSKTQQIDTLTTAQVLQQLQNFVFAPKNILVNPHFNYDDAGWFFWDGIKGTDYDFVDFSPYSYYGKKRALKLITPTNCMAKQFFDIAINTNRISEASIICQATSATGARIEFTWLYHTAGLFDALTNNIVVVTDLNRMPLSPPANKELLGIIIDINNAGNPKYVTDVIIKVI